jgi:VanZ family protein
VRKKAFWLLVALYCGVIFYLSSLANPLPLLTRHVWDKLLHTTEYGALGALLALALGVWDQPRRGWRVGLAILLGCLYGVSDETHQFFVPGRDAEVGDALADTLGASLGASGVWLLALWWEKGSRIDDGTTENSG